MTTVLRSLARHLPEGAVRRLRSTPVHRAYHYLLVRTLRTVETEVTCGERTVSIEVAEGSVYAQSDRFEPVLSDALCGLLDSSSVYYDVGSQYGYFIALARAAGVPDDRIYGFDINPYALHVLWKNYSGTDVTVTDARVSDTPGTDSVVLDEFAAANEAPTVVKIDVEGAELSVLRGMQTVLEEDRPDVFLELHPTELADAGRSDAEAVQMLESADYSVRTCDHRDEDSTWKEVSDAQRSGDQTYLVWARPDERD